MKSFGLRINILIVVLIFAILAIAPVIKEGELHTNIQKGLDLAGGTRVLLKPVSDEPIQDSDVEKLVNILGQRINVYGLRDLSIRPSVINNEKFVLIEIAGVSKDEIEGFISQQGLFEAKISNKTVFTGGKDVPFICKDDGTCSGIRSCSQRDASTYGCTFDFAIKLSPDAASRFAEATKDLEIISTPEGGQRLSENIDYYLDGSLIDSLTISASLKGSASTDIQISGPGVGADQREAFDDASEQMKKLQTVLETGSLPFKLNIERIDSISPLFGQSFIKNAFVTGFVALIGVLGVIYIRYRKFKIIIPMAIVLISEIVIILGFASLFKWNMDLASIAGIIASVGTGVDDQIVITDETLRKKKEEDIAGLKEKIKRAFYIIFTAYACTVAAMLPLIWSVAGLLRGFAFTTIVGVTIGVLITRPAFGAMLERLLKE